MINEYIESLMNKRGTDEKLSYAESILVMAYRSPDYDKLGRICFSESIGGINERPGGLDNTVELIHHLVSAGINEIYVTGEWSNQFDSWLALDKFGLKLRGIVEIEDGRYLEDMMMYGSSHRKEKKTALRFSFIDDSEETKKKAE